MITVIPFDERVFLSDFDIDSWTLEISQFIGGAPLFEATIIVYGQRYAGKAFQIGKAFEECFKNYFEEQMKKQEKNNNET